MFKTAFLSWSCYAEPYAIFGNFHLKWLVEKMNQCTSILKKKSTEKKEASQQIIILSRFQTMDIQYIKQMF